MDKVIFVLGAKDVEMNAIEQLLKQAGVQYVYACDNAGKRCHPGNAYKATGFSGEVPDNDRIVRVECNGPAFDWIDTTRITVVDHHFPVDPGYGKGPEEYLEASSIGQTWQILRDELGLIYWGTDIPLDYVAAADHCLEAAYRGKCPKIDPEKLKEYRIKWKSELTGKPVEEIRSDIDKAICILKDAMRMNSVLRVEKPYADLRGMGSIPELPEASCIAGIPFVADQSDRDGRKKVVLMGVPQGSDLVQRFMNGELVSGLCEYYGDPARGFAGGYLTNE